MSAARQGSAQALGELLESYRNYLLLIANAEVDGELRPKCGASDLVQETFVRAQQGFVAFAGTTEAELQAWLRQILLNHCRNLRQTYRDTQKRDVGRELALDGLSSIVGLGARPSTGQLSPSGCAIASEEAARVAQALSALPDDYQQVVRLRNWENLSFQVIGERLGRSADAARKLWGRAILQLGAEWDASHDQSERTSREA
jgi:RNA polymerase sigma-70 factor (ECF subfamily)